jgi:hypothetical protein
LFASLGCRIVLRNAQFEGDKQRFETNRDGSEGIQGREGDMGKSLAKKREKRSFRERYGGAFTETRPCVGEGPHYLSFT